MTDKVPRRLCWRRRHETVLQWFLKYPFSLRSDCARATGYSATHISRITCTEEFNARIAKAFDAANDQIARDQISDQILNGRRRTCLSIRFFYIVCAFVIFFRNFALPSAHDLP